jgi:hypothetical protein
MENDKADDPYLCRIVKGMIDVVRMETNINDTIHSMISDGYELAYALQRNDGAVILIGKKAKPHSLWDSAVDDIRSTKNVKDRVELAWQYQRNVGFDQRKLLEAAGPILTRDTQPGDRPTNVEWETAVWTIARFKVEEKRVELAAEYEKNKGFDPAKLLHDANELKPI